MSEERIRISQVLAGALAAVTAAVLGSTMGVAGTVIGAGLASVVSTVGGALYLRSIQRTRQSVLKVTERVVARAGSTTVAVAEKEPAEPEENRRRRWPAVIVGGVAAFVLGMAVITGVEWVRGEPLSGGEGTTVGDIVAPQPDTGGERDEAPPQEPTTTPSTGGSTVTVTPTPTPTSEVPDPSGQPSGTSDPPTTPTTTTTGGESSGASSVPPSG